MRNKKIAKKKVLSVLLSASFLVSQQVLVSADESDAAIYETDSDLQSEIMDNIQDIENAEDPKGIDPKAEDTDSQNAVSENEQEEICEAEPALSEESGESFETENPPTVLLSKNTSKGWVEENGNTCYYDTAGNKLTGWHTIDGSTYYFDQQGILYKKGWLKWNSHWYYLDPETGIMKTGWLKLKDIWYYLDVDGTMLTGLVTVSGKKYILQDSGAMLSGDGWVHYMDYWYYLDPDGHIFCGGWLKVHHVWYYLEPETGIMKTGWMKLKNTWYYLNKSGAMLEEKWHKSGSNWYYLGKSGAMQYGWQKISDVWYYLGTAEDGAMKTGWQKISGKWYYLGTSKDGVMKFGWKKISGKWYYFGNSNDGAMKTGWQKLSGKWYYFGDDSDGSMKSGWKKISGDWYYLGTAEDGAMKTGWQKISGKWYYLEKSGPMVTGWQTIGKSEYYFYSDGSMASDCAMDGFYLSENGIKLTRNNTLGNWKFPCSDVTYVSSEFGPRESPGGIGSTDHKGVDLAAPAESKIFSVAPGKVIAAGYGSGGEGNYVEIDHGDGVHTVYMHMISKPAVKPGETVKSGQLIGYVGMTGAATGYHLHFGVKLDDTYVNPWNHLERPDDL